MYLLESNGDQSNHLLCDKQIPDNFCINPPYPNPFNMETKISISLHESGDLCVNIYNVKGQLIKSFSAENVQEGTHQFIWNGTNEYGSAISSGLYILRATFTGVSGKHEVDTRRLILMK